MLSVAITKHKSRNVLIVGPDKLLGSYLAALCLINSRDQIFCLADHSQQLWGNEISDRVTHSMCYFGNNNSDDFLSRLHRLAPAPGQLESVLPENIDHAWFFSGGRSTFVRRRRPRLSTEMPGWLMEILQKTGAPLNYVGDLYDNRWRKAAAELEQHQIRNRFFLTSLIVGDSSPHDDAEYHDFLHFLAVLHQLKAEIREKSPDYFEFQSLRCHGPADAKLNLIRAEDAADLLLRISNNNSTLGRCYEIASPTDTTFDALCERIGEAYSVGLLAADEDTPLNVVDRLLEARLCGFREYLTIGRSPDCKESYLAAGIDLLSIAFGEEEQITLFKAIREHQDAQRQERLQRAAALPLALQRKTITRRGSDLTYFVGGSHGSTVVFLNALGQEMHYWLRLMERMMRKHRIIYWHPRGTMEPPSFGLEDQVLDLDAVLQNEQVDICHLVGWCTGPKVAMKFYLHRPAAVLSMVLLNMTVKCFGSPEDLATIYEHNFEPLCQILKDRPMMAASVMKSLQSSMVESDAQSLAEMEPDALALSVLSSINLDLTTHVLAPFRSETSMLNYAHQTLDFWSHDIRDKATQINVPVLLIGSEYDKIASPNTLRSVSPLFPRAHSLQIQGASHYCLYENPDLIADLIEGFFQNPDDKSAVYGDVSEVQSAKTTPAYAAMMDASICSKTGAD